ncbi:hypothetical protein WN944_023433 [Citrus x changshan-huyou]|uniref:Uncharacterized protein n=1 Tax=Citrus x changshan-huyou TaxID=2935761 RepID=A0AAP0N0D0_9ROSI
MIYTEWVRVAVADSHGFEWLGSRRTGAGFNVGCCCCSGFVNRGVVLAGFVGGCCYGDFARLLGSLIATSLLLVVLVAAGSEEMQIMKKFVLLAASIELQIQYSD